MIDTEHRAGPPSDAGTWKAVREGLDAFQPAPLAARLREYLAPRIPPGATHLDERTRHALLEGVSALLAKHAGAWYTRVNAQLGNESLGGRGWRDNFLPNQDRSRDWSVESNIQRILSALGVAHEWLCTLDTYFRSLALPRDAADRRMVLSDAVKRVIDLTARATGCEEAWHHHVHLAVGWLLESQGVRRTESVERVLNESLMDFTSGSAPSADEARQVADTIARAAVKADIFPHYLDEEAS